MSAGLCKMIGWLFPACKSEQGTGCQSPVDHHHVRKPAGEYIKPVSVNCPSAVLPVAATKSKKRLPGPWLASPRIKIAMGLALSPQFRTWHQLTQDRVPIIRYLCLEKFPWHNNHCTSFPLHTSRQFLLSMIATTSNVAIHLSYNKRTPGLIFNLRVWTHF